MRSAIDLGNLFSQSSVTVGHVIVALLMAAATWLLWRLSRKGATRLLGRLSGISEQAKSVTARAVGYAVLLVGIASALAVLGVTIQPLVAVCLILLAVLALVLRGTADNFAAGVVIQTRQPIRIGDLVEVAGCRGFVKEVNGRAVILLSPDGRTVHIPNGETLSNPIVNFTAGGVLRGEAEVRTARAFPTDRLLSLLCEAARGVPAVADRPEPEAFLRSAAPDRCTVLLRYWYRWDMELEAGSQVVSAVAAVLERDGLPAVVVTPPPRQPLTPPAAL
ncbi:hypothetical protein GCM10009830_23720 [Glycomyces endophyticus]|uniref:Mechanosensitive ion channel n=1 Tax=Glycomyces endophyticus TaxID=480996 RepID=A0ABN2GSX3_9ACTN